jgi:hypothetical protein
MVFLQYLIPIQYLFSLYLSWKSCHVSSFNLYQTLNPCSKVLEFFDNGVQYNMWYPGLLWQSLWSCDSQGKLTFFCSKTAFGVIVSNCWSPLEASHCKCCCLEVTKHTREFWYCLNFFWVLCSFYLVPLFSLSHSLLLCSLDVWSEILYYLRFFV